jgi:hypothetical protein
MATKFMIKRSLCSGFLRRANIDPITAYQRSRCTFILYFDVRSVRCMLTLLHEWQDLQYRAGEDHDRFKV